MCSGDEVFLLLIAGYLMIMSDAYFDTSSLMASVFLVVCDGDHGAGMGVVPGCWSGLCLITRLPSAQLPAVGCASLAGTAPQGACPAPPTHQTFQAAVLGDAGLASKEVEMRAEKGNCVGLHYCMRRVLVLPLGAVAPPCSRDAKGSYLW